MKAVYCPRYGAPDVLELRDIPKPTVKKNHVLVKVKAVAATSGDARLRAARFPAGMALMARLFLGLFGPRNPILGFSFAGEIAEVGENVDNFHVGQRVLGMTGNGFGGYAEFKLIRSDAPMIVIPDELDFETAAAMSFGGTTAIHYLNKMAKVANDERVLIIGGSGQVGIAGIQIAKSAGAHVTAVCSASNHDTVRSVGADNVIDYHQTNFIDQPETYDIIMDCAGASRFKFAKHRLNNNGRYLVIAGDLKDMISSIRGPDTNGRNAISGVASEEAKDLETLVSLWRMGKFDPLITSRFPLEQMAEAHTLIDSGRKVGSVVLTVNEPLA